MFQRILIANRGEIAVRIIRACKELGISTVAIYSQADEHSLHVQLADDAICVGPAPAAESYLKISNIISAAEVADVDAIHPGYGFMSENAHFAEICENCNITFIGPSPDNIRRMGDKAMARETMRSAGVPVTPGSEGVVATKDEALRLAQDIGYPVLVKAVSGGGGKGMRVAHNAVSLVQAFMTAASEAERAFGDSTLYLEKYIESARHIEVQLIGDKHGHAIHLGERDCSIQRRHQKMIEEARCPALNDDVRDKMFEAALLAAHAVKYSSVGTVEFLYDENEKNAYFMEMNTRVQVEHPVTEEITGVDIIKEQIKVAAGHELSFKQEDIQFNGHAIELRINAEDPYNNFAPSPGVINWIHFPGGKGVRVDTHVYPGYMVSPYYDSMIGKLIVHGHNRESAIQRMASAIDEFMIEGVCTTVPLAQTLIADPRFKQGKYNTHFLDKFLREGYLVQR